MRYALALLPLCLAACDAEDAVSTPLERDPATEQALADQIMVDPDLANQNEANAALTVSSDHALPLEIATPEAIAMARAEAAALVEGADTPVPPPRPRRSAEPSRRFAMSTAATRAAMIPGGSACVQSLRFSAVWAARMPAAFPIYPRAATREAAGADRAGCHVRSVTFSTPVPLDEVLAFYYARGTAAGFGIEHSAGGGEHDLAGTRGGAAFALRLRPLADGMTRADLVTGETAP